MAEPIANAHAGQIQSFRELAENCRKMAALTRRPAPLLMRAQAFEATALALEHAAHGE